MNLLEKGALAKGPVMSRDSSIHGASGGGIVLVGTVSWGLTASEEQHRLHDSQNSFTDELPPGQK